MLLSIPTSEANGNDYVNAYFINVLDDHLVSNIIISHTIIPHSGAVTT